MQDTLSKHGGGGAGEKGKGAFSQATRKGHGKSSNGNNISSGIKIIKP